MRLHVKDGNILANLYVLWYAESEQLTNSVPATLEIIKQDMVVDIPRAQTLMKDVFTTGTSNA